MDTDTALKLLRQVAEQFRGSWEEHQLLQQALIMLTPEPKDTSSSK